MTYCRQKHDLQAGALGPRQTKASVSFVTGQLGLKASACKKGRCFAHRPQGNRSKGQTCVVSMHR